MMISEHKKVCRKAAYTARAKVHANVDPAPAQDAMLRYVRAVPTIEVVAGYAPIRTEIDPTPVLEQLHRDGMSLCLPVVTGPGEPLKFRSWAPGDPMEEGAFGAPIPAHGEEVEPELLITPLLAFDDSGYRLGYGGGFYDRTLQKLRDTRRTYAVGLAYDAQQIPLVPRDATDQRLDAVITERRCYYAC